MYTGHGPEARLERAVRLFASRVQEIERREGREALTEIRRAVDFLPEDHVLGNPVALGRALKSLGAGMATRTLGKLLMKLDQVEQELDDRERGRRSAGRGDDGQELPARLPVSSRVMKIREFYQRRGYGPPLDE